MSERPFMQLYTSDFLGDTQDLSAEYIGSYMLLLMTMWNKGGSLPFDEVKLARVARLTVEEWRLAWADLGPLFDVIDGKLSHGRLTFELTKFATKSAARKEAGSRGGKSKSLKDKKAALAIASGLPQHLPKPEYKKRARALAPTDSAVKLDRFRDEDLFKACEKLTEPVPSFMQFQMFDRDIVAQAQASLKTGSVH